MQPGQITDMQEMDDGGLEVELFDDLAETEDDQFMPGGHYENLVELIDDARELTEIGLEVIENLEADEESRQNWEDILTRGIDMLGLNPDGGDAYGQMVDGMCTADHPLLLESAVKFQSKFTAELLPAKGPVRTQIIGKGSDEKEMQAIRVQQHMNYQLTHEMPEYADEMDKLGFHLPLYGSAFKKMYWDQFRGRPVSEFVHPTKFVVSENAKSLETAERYTHIIEKTTTQLQREIEAGVFYDWGHNMGLMGGTGDNDLLVGREEEILGSTPTHSIPANQVITLYEQHVYMALPDYIDQGLVRPYVITVNADTAEVLSIRRNWSPNDKKMEMRQWFVHYKYVPGFGFHGLGLIHLLGDMQKTLSTVLRSLVDAGQYANLQGGFKAKGVKMDKSDEPIGMGEFREVESTNEDIHKSLMPLPFKEPSATLYQLLEYLTGASQKFADSTEQVVADSSNYGPVGTTMALLEASVKFFSAIHKRAHRAQGKELKILAALNFEFLEDSYPYDVVGGNREVMRQDYDPRIVDVIPASDPNITSQAHRISLAQTKLQAALQAPQIHNLKECFKDFYLALGVDDIDEFLLPDSQAQPQGPMEDIMAAQKGAPIAAFPGQNHQAHIMFKMAWLQDPTQGGSKMFPHVIPALQANIQEHTLMDFQEKVQAQLTGAATDPQTQEFAMAQIAQRVSQQNQMLADAEEAGGPAGMIAKAELMKSAAAMMKEQREGKESAFELGIKLLDALNSVEREKTRAKEAARRYELDEDKLAADLLKESAKLASGEKNMFAKEAGADRRDQRKAKGELLKEAGADRRDRRKAESDAMKIGRDNKK